MSVGLMLSAASNLASATPEYEPFIKGAVPPPPRPPEQGSSDARSSAGSKARDFQSGSHIEEKSSSFLSNHTSASPILRATTRQENLIRDPASLNEQDVSTRASGSMSTVDSVDKKNDVDEIAVAQGNVDTGASEFFASNRMRDMNSRSFPPPKGQGASTTFPVSIHASSESSSLQSIVPKPPPPPLLSSKRQEGDAGNSKDLSRPVPMSVADRYEEADLPVSPRFQSSPLYNESLADAVIQPSLTASSTVDRLESSNLQNPSNAPPTAVDGVPNARTQMGNNIGRKSEKDSLLPPKAPPVPPRPKFEKHPSKETEDKAVDYVRIQPPPILTGSDSTEKIIAFPIQEQLKQQPIHTSSAVVKPFADSEQNDRVVKGKSDRLGPDPRSPITEMPADGFRKPWDQASLGAVPDAQEQYRRSNAPAETKINQNALDPRLVPHAEDSRRISESLQGIDMIRDESGPTATQVVHPPSPPYLGPQHQRPPPDGRRYDVPPNRGLEQSQQYRPYNQQSSKIPNLPYSGRSTPQRDQYRAQQTQQAQDQIFPTQHATGFLQKLLPTTQGGPFQGIRKQQQPQKQQGYPHVQRQTWQGPPSHFTAPQHPPGPRNQVQNAKGASGKPPAWKQLWKKMELGLDSLADWEEAVTGRAKMLYTATLETASSAIKIPLGPQGNKNTDDEEDSDFEPETTVPAVQLPVRKWNIPKRPKPNPTITNPTVTNQESIVTRHIAMRQKQEIEKLQKPGQAVESPGKTVDWNGVVSNKSNRPVVANGGASPRPGDKNANSGPPHESANLQDGGTNSDVNPTYQSAPFQENGIPGTGTPSYPSPPSYGTAAGDARQPPEPISSTNAPFSGVPTSTQTTAKHDSHRRDMRSLLGATRPETRPGFVPPPSNQQSKSVSRPKVEDVEELTWQEKLVRFMPSFPSLNLFKWRRDSFEYATTMDAWNAEDVENEATPGFLGFWRRKKAGDFTRKRSGSSMAKPTPPVTPLVSALMGRCQQGESLILLKDDERRKCVSLGRKRGFVDLATLFFLLCAWRELAKVDPLAIAYSAKNLVEASTDIRHKLVDGWFAFAAQSATLSFLTNVLLLKHQRDALANEIGNQVQQEAEYGSLFLRIMSSIPTKRYVIEQVQATSIAQCLALVESARLVIVVVVLLSTFVFTTLSLARPLFLAIINTALEIASLAGWRVWPIEWKSLLQSIQNLLVQFFHVVRSVIGAEIKFLSKQPFRLAYDGSICFVLFLLTQLSRWEISRSVKALDLTEDGTSTESRLNHAAKVSNLGVSSATRLQLMSKRSSVDEVLERWRTASSASNSGQGEQIPVALLLREVLLGLFSGLLLSVPVLIFAQFGISGPVAYSDVWVRWDSLREVAFVLIYVQALFLSAINRAVRASSAKMLIVGFRDNFVSAVKERTKQWTAPPANLQLQASISATAGITVRDLWAAHATRRAWGVRGANLACRNGEVVLVLGDDGAGKSKLLTTIAEGIIVPGKQAQTVTRVRGSISIGGLDVTKWDPNQLRKRVGLMLNDVRTISDFSQAFSGLTLEEILTPGDGVRTSDPTHAIGLDAKSSVILALKISGLYSTLLPRLPFKLSTVVTGNEEDLNPSPLRPHCTILSPVEWSKLLLARLLAQSIYDNENAASSKNKLENCMIGSVLLLDDVAIQFSEADEGRLLKELRSSSAATVLTSNRWAMGRFADRIVVLQDGSVAETGTHNELLKRGPQQSIYAARWLGMTSS